MKSALLQDLIRLEQHGRTKVAFKIVFSDLVTTLQKYGIRKPGHID